MVRLRIHFRSGKSTEITAPQESAIEFMSQTFGCPATDGVHQAKRDWSFYRDGAINWNYVEFVEQIDGPKGDGGK